MTRQDAEVLMLRQEVEKVSAERDAMRTALSSVRKAAGSGRDMTNRLQFIYARAGAAIDGLPWDDSWKAEHGYTMRDRTLRENDLLRAEVERLRADAERLDWMESKRVTVHGLRRWGSGPQLFSAEPDLEDERFDLRALIDAARAALGAEK